MSATLNQDIPDPAEAIRSSKDTAHSLPAAFREFLGFWSPRILLTGAVLTTAARLWVGQWGMWDALIPAITLAAWPVQEWLIHVFILHWKPKKIGPITLDPLAARKHRDHHQDPWNLRDTFIPVPVLLVAYPFVAAVWWLITPSVPLFLTGLAFYSVMATIYEWSHYLIHSRYRPKSAFYKRLWKHHRWHHCKNEKFWYGVSMIGGDRLFGTAPDVKEVETSPTCRTIVPE